MFKQFDAGDGMRSVPHLLYFRSHWPISVLWDSQRVFVASMFLYKLITTKIVVILKSYFSWLCFDHKILEFTIKYKKILHILCKFPWIAFEHMKSSVMKINAKCSMAHGKKLNLCFNHNILKRLKWFA